MMQETLVQCPSCWETAVAVGMHDYRYGECRGCGRKMSIPELVKAKHPTVGACKHCGHTLYELPPINDEMGTLVVLVDENNHGCCYSRQVPLPHEVQ